MISDAVRETAMPTYELLDFTFPKDLPYKLGLNPFYHGVGLGERRMMTTECLD